MKRVFDVVVAAMVSVVLLPLLALIAVSVWICDPGPIFYRGMRIGRGGRIFRMWKFRTMMLRPLTQSEITVSGDARVLPLGKVLRATKLDELPQLFNVLRGDMSLVGPRPESPRYVAEYNDAQRAEVLSVRPGVTGLSQLYFRHEERLLAGADPERLYREVFLPSKLAVDLAYVRHQAFRFDLEILGMTLLALVRPVSPRLLRRFGAADEINAATVTRVAHLVEATKGEHDV